jgi:prevent-host-death family protein
MSQVEIGEAGPRLRDLIERARAGEDVVLTDGGRECARILPLDRTGPPGPDAPIHHPVTLGRLQGRFRVPDDFDAPLPDDLLDLFEGKS